MGTYFNPTNESFVECTNDSLYIDKTGLLKLLNARIRTPSKCIALSHARRFGKTQAADMIDAYYSKGCDSKELFSQFEIAKASDFERHLNKYNVIHLDMAEMYGMYRKDILRGITETLFEEFREAYPEVASESILGKAIMKVYTRSSTPFVIIIDEWDYIIWKCYGEQLIYDYMQLLHLLFKSESSRKFLALGYITGILPIKKVEDESALNNFSEYTMLSSKIFTQYYGFTEGEVKKLCSSHGMDFKEVKDWYDGYMISGTHMYNPDSVVHAIKDENLGPYWKNTSAFSRINKLISYNYAGLKEDILLIIAKKRITVKTANFCNDIEKIKSKDDALTALIHLGYLAYDENTGEAYMPNYEVSSAYGSALETGNWEEIAKIIAQCDDILRATLRMEADKVADFLDLIHEEYSSILTYNDENSLACTVRVGYFTAPAYYTLIRELPAGKGFADIAFIPHMHAGERPAMIVELKWDKDADTAIRQIKERRYAGALAGYGKDILLVGINYDMNTKQHTCIIEKA